MPLYDHKGREISTLATLPEPEKSGRETLANLSNTAHDIQVTRSFAFKLNLGNYESADFFCSQKADCSAADADTVSADLYEFCIDEVMKSVLDLKRRRAEKEAKAAAQGKRG